MEEETQFIDARQWSGTKDQQISFTDIVFQQIKRITALQSVEMRGGFWVFKVKTKAGVETEEKSYIPDTRESFSGAIDNLHDLLLPFFDGKIRDALKKINKSLKKARKDCLANTKKDEKEILSDEYYKGADKEVIEEYRFKKLRYKRKVFQKLMLLLQREGYFKGKTFEDVV